MRLNILTIAVVASIVASATASPHADHSLTKLARKMKRGNADSYGGSDDYSSGYPGGSTMNSGQSQGGGGGGGGGGYGPPVTNPDASCHYMPGPDGVYTLSTDTQVSGCDYQVTVPNSHPADQQYSCNAPGSKSLIGIDALNCLNLCVLSTECPPPQSCSAVSNGQLIDVNALNCANIALLAGPGGLLGALGLGGLL